MTEENGALNITPPTHKAEILECSVFCAKAESGACLATRRIVWEVRSEVFLEGNRCIVNARPLQLLSVPPETVFASVCRLRVCYFHALRRFSCSTSVCARRSASNPNRSSSVHCASSCPSPPRVSAARLRWTTVPDRSLVRFGSPPVSCVGFPAELPCPVLLAPSSIGPCVASCSCR